MKLYQYRNISVLLGLRNPDTTRGKKSLVEGFQWVDLGLQNCCRIMEGEDSLLHFSPEALVHSSDFKQAATQLPPVTLFHGTSDYSIPCGARWIYISFRGIDGAMQEEFGLLENLPWWLIYEWTSLVVDGAVRSLKTVTGCNQIRKDSDRRLKLNEGMCTLKASEWSMGFSL